MQLDLIVEGAEVLDLIGVAEGEVGEAGEAAGAEAVVSARRNAGCDGAFAARLSLAFGLVLTVDVLAVWGGRSFEGPNVLAAAGRSRVMSVSASSVNPTTGGAPVTGTVTSAVAGAKPIISTRMDHAPSAIAAKRKTPPGSVTVMSRRSPCVAATDAPGMGTVPTVTWPVRIRRTMWRFALLLLLAPAPFALLWTLHRRTNGRGRIPDERALAAGDMMGMATRYGAESAMWPDAGTLASGMRADVVTMKLDRTLELGEIETDTTMDLILQRARPIDIGAASWSPVRWVARKAIRVDHEAITSPDSASPWQGDRSW